MNIRNQAHQVVEQHEVHRDWLRTLASHVQIVREMIEGDFYTPEEIDDTLTLSHRPRTRGLSAR